MRPVTNREDVVDRIREQRREAEEACKRAELREADRTEVVRKAREARRIGRAIVEAGERMLAEADSLERLLVDGEARVLRGRQSTDRLAGLVGIGDEHHYEDLLGILRAHGDTVAGADPAASLLASLQRSSYFVVVRPRSGLYRRVVPLSTDA